MFNVDTGSVHHSEEHVLSEFHLRRTVFASIFATLVCRFISIGCFRFWFGFLGFRFDRGQVVRFNFITEVDAVEAVESFCIDFAASLDVKRNFEAFAFLHLGNMPKDVEAAFTLFGGHLDVVALPVGTLHLPVLDLKLRW